MTNSLDDQTLGEQLRAEVPVPGAGYWSTIDARLAAATPAVAAGDIGPNADPIADPNSDGIQSIDILLDSGAGPEAGANVTSIAGRLRAWPVLAAAAALIFAVVLLGARVLSDNGEAVDAGFASEQEQTDAALDDLPGPAQNLDHWNAVYGVWDCAADSGAGEWLPVFASTEDNVGIHSHGDGRISVHAFFEESAGKNATFSHFADSMNFEITDTTITLDDGRVLAAGTTCGGEPAVIQMLRWQDAPALEADPSLPPRVITQDFNTERFYNDLEVWTLALAPLGAEIPLPPSERFDTFTPGPLDDAEILPPYDSFTNVRLAESGSDADDIINQMLDWPPEAERLPGALIPGTGKRWIAESRDASTVIHMATFEATIDDTMADGSDPNAPAQWTCQVIALPDEEMLQSARCGGSPATLYEGTRIEVDVHAPTHTAIELWNADPDAAWLVVELETGERVLANVVDGISYAAWPNTDGLWTLVEVLDLDLNVVWVETCRLPTSMSCARG